jgi:amino acid transporter
MSLLASKTRSPSSSTASPGLRLHVLGFPTLLAQSIALISPTMTAVLIIPLAFSTAGQGTWLAYAFGTVMLMFVVLNLNQFAKRSTSAGSMFSYTARGLGPAAGVASGWTLLWCYLFIGIAGLSGFAVFSQQFLSAIGVNATVPPIIFFLLSAAACWFVAFKDIRISSLLTLALEGLSVACILSLAGVVLFKHGFHVDSAQVKLSGVGLHGMSLAVVACIFSLVGFESATALGSEARDPLRNVPRAVVWSLILTGAFMVIMAYVEVSGTAHLSTSLAAMGAPLIVLSKAYHVSAFRAPISLGAMVSFYGLSLSCLNAGSRILYPMAEHAVMPKALSRAHHRNQTPHVAITAFIAVMVTVPMILEINHNPLTIFDDAGTLAAFGFLLAYFLITVAAPVYLKRIGELKRSHVVIAVVAFLALLVPTEGSFYPLPPYPVRLFPYMFAGYLVLGAVWLAVVRRRNPQVLLEIAADLAAAPSVPIAGAVLTPQADELLAVVRLPESSTFLAGELAADTA